MACCAMGVRPDEPITPEMPALCAAHTRRRDLAAAGEKRERAAAAARFETEEREQQRRELEGLETWDRDRRSLQWHASQERRGLRTFTEPTE